MGQVIVGNSRALPPPSNGPVGLQIIWTGSDGVSWDLTSGSDGVALQPGYRGFSAPVIDYFDQQGVNTDGSYNKGYRVPPREVFLPLLILADDLGGSDFTDKDSKFFDGLTPGGYGTLTCITPNGNARYLTCRFQSDSDHGFSSDPAYRGWEIYGINLLAEDPWWYGPDVEEHFYSSGDEDYYNRSETGQVAYLSPSFSKERASITNPGDVESWITWTIWSPSGTMTGFKVGVNGYDIIFPGAITTVPVTIDTNPRDRRVLRSGTDLSPSLSAIPRFDPVPKGASVPLWVSEYSGTVFGTVKATLKPRYFRAW